MAYLRFRAIDLLGHLLFGFPTRDASALNWRFFLISFVAIHAQAFRPGKAPSKFALKGRPTGADENEYLAIHVERSSHSAALSGRIPSGKNPGLEGLCYGL